MNQDKSLSIHATVNKRLVLWLRLVLPFGRLQPKMKGFAGASGLLARMWSRAALGCCEQPIALPYA
jgi:hypothetical protein